MELTVISPHPDDAAFSLGGTLDALARRGVAITLVSCHSRSVWAPTLSRRRTADLVSAVRGREDRAYAELLGARLVPRGFADAPLRTPSRPVMGRGSRCDGAH